MQALIRIAVLVSLGLSVLLSLTNPAALKTGTVTNGESIPVVVVGSGLIAVAPAVGGSNAAETAYLDPGGSNVLLLDFQKGFGKAASFGFAPHTLAGYYDMFKFRGAFSITNNSANKQSVCVYASPALTTPSDLDGIYLRLPTDTTGSGTQVAGEGGGKGTCLLFQPGDKYDVDVWWVIRSAAATKPSFSIRVEGTRVYP